MKPWLRVALWTIAALLAFFVVASLGLWTVQYAVSTDELQQAIEEGASKYLNRDVTIERIDRPTFPSMEVVAHGLTMKSKSGEVIVTAKEVHAQASLSAIGHLRLGIDNMTFEQPVVTVRYRPDGRTNIEGIAKELLSRGATVRRSVGAMVFNKFKIHDGAVMVVSANGESLLRSPLRVNGEVTLKIGTLGIWAPFRLDVDGGDHGPRARVVGRFSGDPMIDITFERVPAPLLAPRFDILARCDGETDGRFAWNGGNGESYDFAFSPMRVCGGAGVLPDRLSGTIGHNGRRWSVAVKATSERTDADVAGADDGGRTPARWTLTGSRLDTGDVTGWVTQSREVLGMTGSPPRSGPVRAISFTATVSSVTAGPLAFENAHLEVTRSTDGVIRCNSLTAGLFGGHVQASGVLDGNIMSVRADADSVQLERAAAFTGSTSPITGLLSAKLQGQGLTTDLAYGFTGDVSARLIDGRLPEVPTILKTLSSANLVKLEDQMRGEKQKGIEITQADASATIKGGVADVNHLMLDSRVLRLGFTGKLAFIDRKIDGTIVLQPLNIADQLINEIPILRTLLHGKDKTFLPLWFSVKGPWTDPHVRPMPTKSLAAPVKNIFDAVLNFPQRAYKTITGEK